MNTDFYVPLGDRIAVFRQRRGYSQLRLGAMIDRSEDWVSKVERGVIPVDRLSVLVQVADALHITLGELLRDIQPLGEDVGQTNADPPAVQGLRRQLARLTGRHGTAREHTTLRADLDAATRLRADGRYMDLGTMLPSLLADLEASADDDDAVLPLLARAYCEGEVLASSRGVHDLAWIAADRAVQTARRAEDAVVFAECAFWLTHAHLGAGRLDDAITVANDGLERAATDRGNAAVRALSGAIHLPLGIALGRRGDGFGAEAAFDEAAALARGHDGAPDVPAVVAQRTQFGPANIGLHQVSGAVEQGRANEALRLAGRLDARGLPASRQARFHVDVGFAHAQRRDTAGMVAALVTAEQHSPESVRDIPLVREMVHAALRRQRSGGNRQLRALADRVGAT